MAMVSTVLHTPVLHVCFPAIGVVPQSELMLTRKKGFWRCHWRTALKYKCLHVINGMNYRQIIWKCYAPGVRQFKTLEHVSTTMR